MAEPRWTRARRRAARWVTREREPLDVAPELYRRSVKASRGLALAEALLVLVLGFTLDDLGLLTFPGYAVAAVTAILVLAGGRLLHGRSLARRITAHRADDAQAALDAARLRNTLAAIAAVIVFLAWLVIFSAGVPPWTL